MLDLAAYDRAHAVYKARKRVLDRAIEELCSRYPRHDNLAGVHAKVCIITRAYAARLESMVGGEGALGIAVDHLVERRARVDRIVGRVRKLARGKLDVEELTIILEEHAALDAVLAEVTHEGKSVRSFCAKYLHFHNPVVPIFDSLADKRLKTLVPRPKQVLPLVGDPAYRGFLNRYRVLQRELVNAGRKPSARRIDSYLLLEG